MIEFIKEYIAFEKSLNKLTKIFPKPKQGMAKLHLLPIEFYQDNFRIYLDEYEVK